MKSVANRRNALIVLAIVALFPAWSSSAPIRGRWLAQFDVAQGHYRILRYGLPARGSAEYELLLRERYGIESRRVAFCIVSQQLVAYAGSYNAVSTAAIERKFGRDVLKENWDEAIRLWQQTHKAELQNVSRSE
jgi:hypothetical protein